jgi:hypothetical protein
MAKKPTGTPLAGKNVSDAEAIGSVIRLRSQLEAARREIIALRKDRDDLLDEHVDLRKARTPHALKPNRPAPRKDDFVRVSCGDVHGMMRSKRAVEAFLGDLAQWSPDEIVLGGDILECGGWLAKHQPIGFVALCDYSYQEDVAAANQFLDEVQKRAPKARLHYLEGNHEARVERWIVDQTMAHKRDAEFLRAMCAPEVVLGLKERGIPYYRMSEEHLTGLPRGWVKFGKLHYTHALGTSKNAARAAAERTAGNVVFFHTHREDTATLVLPGVGIVKAFNPGCLCSRQPVWKNSDPTNWSHGYGVEFVAKSGDFLRLTFRFGRAAA